MVRKPIIFAVGLAVLALAACGPRPAGAPAAGGHKLAKGEVPGAPAQVGATFSGIGVLAEEKWPILVIDHEAVPEAGLAAGRTEFRAFADVVAEAPGQPGARIAFSFRRAESGPPQLTELKARP